MYSKSGRIAVILVILAFGAGCDSQAERQKSLTAVRVLTLAGAEAGKGQKYSVSIVPYTQVNLSFKVSGYIESILQVRGADGRQRDVQQNDRVKKDMTLATVHQSEYLDQLVEARANLSKARAGMAKASDDYRRAQNLYSTESLTQKEFDQARKEYQSYQAEVRGAKAQLDEADTNLKYTRLRVPWDGILLQRNIETGSLVAPGTTGFVLAETTSVKALVGVPDMALSQFRSGQKLKVFTRAAADSGFSGTITAISPEADSRTRLFEVQVTIPNADGRLKPGMIGSVSLPDSPGSVGGRLFVPLDAVVRSLVDPNRFAVYVVEPIKGVETAILRDIEISEDINGNRIGVKQGLKPGERVVVNGAQMLSDHEPVNVIP